jgi:hypothetical protein
VTQGSGIHTHPIAIGAARAAAAGMRGCVRPEPAASRTAFRVLDADSAAYLPAPRGNAGGVIRQPRLGGRRSAAGWMDGRRNRAGCAEGCAVGA